MNVQRSLIRELKIYKFELDHDVAEATKNIWYAKYEDTAIKVE